MVELIDLSTFLRAVSPHLQQLTTRRQLSCNGITRAKCHAVEFYKKMCILVSKIDKWTNWSTSCLCGLLCVTCFLLIICRAILYNSTCLMSA